MMWMVTIGAAAVLAWFLWLWRPGETILHDPAQPCTDPYAAQVAEFRRQVNDYSRG